ncbi:hypothetical protein FQN53_009084 [Emmonsiellopsis sp. PD_33]|nr:hypothetical protein FQN53_009084 [Emmonsiellopsis sp. PD_33]
MPPISRPRKNVKRQSRLSFTPISSSSPGVERSPGSDRLATMRYKNALSSPGSSSKPEKKKTISSLFMSSDSITISSDEESVRAPSSNRRALKRVFVEDEDEDDGDESEDIVTSSPMKRRKRNVVVPEPPAPTPAPRNRAERDRQDLEEDLADLRDSATTKTRTRGRAVDKSRQKRQDQLEALRRRRAGEKGKPEAVSVSSDGESEGEGSESNGDEESSEEEDGPLWNVEDQDSDIEPAAPEDLDKYEEDFVDEDDGKLGVPAGLSDIPFEFTRHRYKRLRDHFKDVVEWMVHNKLNPAFPRDDVVYRVAFSKVKDEVTGLAGSQLISSAWNIDFRRALEARPDIDISLYPTSLGHSCDACNRSGHPASFDIRLLGKPYLLETLEPISDDDSGDTDDSDDDDDSSTDDNPGNVDRQGNAIPDESTHFYLGRHCKSKATMAHTLIHWRYHLNDWVVDYLKRKDIFSDSKILEREHWSQKKRTKYANQVVDRMEEDGEINRLWRDFNTNLKAARDTKEARW